MAPKLTSMIYVCPSSFTKETSSYVTSSIRNQPGFLDNNFWSFRKECFNASFYEETVSKANIMHLAGVPIVDEKTNDELLCTQEEIFQKKIDLAVNIKWKLEELRIMEDLVEIERRQNERLGKQLNQTVEEMCTKKEQNKYNIYVQDVDNIVNLLLSLSGRLTKLENSIQMLPTDADKDQVNLLEKKRQKLNEQYSDAKELKKTIDQKQLTVSEMLLKYFDQNKFADFGHYITTTGALIVKQRELDDKVRLGEEQMQVLRESLPEEWKINLDKILEDE